MTPFACVDVHYEGEGGRAACVVAASFADLVPIEERVTWVPKVLPYRPGAFYERELPCLEAVLALVTSPFRGVVVDGYVDLDEHGTPGLGARLHEALGGSIPVIGVAKTSFRGSSFATPVVRGQSRSPLFVTARGVDRAEAARLVEQMAGPHRIPALLTRVDQLARGTRSVGG